jgi:hypothetical protein
MDAVIGRAENDGVFAIKDVEASKNLRQIPLTLKVLAHLGISDYSLSLSVLFKFGAKALSFLRTIS